MSLTEVMAREVKIEHYKSHEDLEQKLKRVWCTKGLQNNAETCQPSQIQIALSKKQSFCMNFPLTSY